MKTLFIAFILTVTFWLFHKQDLTVKSEKYDFIGMLLKVNDYAPFSRTVTGTHYELFNSTFTYRYILKGTFNKDDSEFLIGIKGKSTMKDEIKVDNYSLLSKIPFHDFLVRKGGAYTADNYKCLLAFNGTGTMWNKTFGWKTETVNYDPILIVRMTDSFSPDPKQAYYELWYDGNSGDFIKEIREPDVDFCD